MHQNEEGRGKCFKHNGHFEIFEIFESWLKLVVYQRGLADVIVKFSPSKDKIKD